MISKIAVIIVTHNGSRYIAKCLTSVFNNKFDGQFNVIVVDNASDDSTVEILDNYRISNNQFPISSKFPITNFQVIKNKKNLGFVGGNNIGIGHALKVGCDAVVLLNQDTEVEYDWLTQLVKASQDERIGIVQSMLLLANERALTNNIGNAMHYLGFGFVKHYRERVDSWYHRPPFEIGYASGAAILIKREVLEKIALAPLTQNHPLTPSLVKEGGQFSGHTPACTQEGAGGWFNPLFFMYHEDLDLCWRARLAGYKIMIAPQATVYHHYQFNRNKKIFYWTERNRWACLLQNYSLITLLKLSPILLFVELAMLGYSLVNGWFWQKIKSYIWIWSHLPAILSARKRVQSRRVVDDKEVMRLMDMDLNFSAVNNSLLKYGVNPLVKLYFKLFLK